MKLPYTWLQDFIPLTLKPQQLADRLTMAGLEVEAIETIADDEVFEIGITPNRGDCLSIKGLARELAALTDQSMVQTKSEPVTATLNDSLPIEVNANSACPRYLGRVIRGVNNQVATPAWMATRLQQCGVNTISPIVDITNYVLLELGQPLHAFDLSQIQQGIQVRYAKANEKIVLLGDEAKEINLRDNTLVIADTKQVLAIAGIKGGATSAVSTTTTDIFLESAFFAPTAIAGQARRYGLATDSAFRFERGVDPVLAAQAIEHATTLILEIVGGQAGPVVTVEATDELPKPATIMLRRARITRLLGMSFADAEVMAILRRLQCQVENMAEGWQIIPPSFRFDLKIEADLIEEVARVHGYDDIGAHHPQLTAAYAADFSQFSERSLPLSRMRQLLVDQGYYEVITYSFVAAKLQELLDPKTEPLALLNPISSEMGVMRTSLWPGLITSLQYNLNRQHDRLRLFETGLRFVTREGELHQEAMIAGLITGSVAAEQWGIAKQPADFFDLKNDVEKLLGLTAATEAYTFVAAQHPALHPGQSAAIYYQDQVIGYIGKLNPAVAQALGLTSAVYIFELALASIMKHDLPTFEPLSKFPQIRRDIAILVNQTITADQLSRTIRLAAGNLLVDLKLFDVYQGKNIPAGQKSVALSLILQATDRTLLDEEINQIITFVVEALQLHYQVSLRV